MSNVLSKIPEIDMGKSNYKKAFACFFALYAVFMIPIAVAFYPVLAPVDFFLQVEDFLSGTHHVDVSGLAGLDIEVEPGLSAHHPIAVTLIYGSLSYLGISLSGNVEHGLLLCQLFNLVAASAVFSFVTCKLLVMFNQKAVLASVVLVLFLPFSLIQVMSCGKDSLFALSFAAFIVLLLEMSATKGESLESPLHVFGLAAAATACVLFRGTGVFIVVPALLISGAVYRNRFASICTAVAACIVIGVLPVCVAISCGALSKDDTFQEAFGNMFQQTAAYSLTYADEQSPAEVAAIDRVLKYDRFAEFYDPDLADGIKFGTFRKDADISFEDKWEYVKVYVSEGLRHPDIYASALFGLMKPYIVPTYATGYEHLFFFVDDDIRAYLEENHGISLTEDKFPEGSVIEGIQSPEILAWMFDNGKAPGVRMNSGYFDALGDFMDTNTDTPLKRFYQMLPYCIFSVPIVGMLTSKACFALYFPILILLLSLARKKDAIPYVVPIGLLMLSLLFCPHAPERYIAPLIVIDQFLLIPLAVEVAVLFAGERRKKPENC